MSDGLLMLRDCTNNSGSSTSEVVLLSLEGLRWSML